MIFGGWGVALVGGFDTFCIAYPKNGFSKAVMLIGFAPGSGDVNMCETTIWCLGDPLAAYDLTRSADCLKGDGVGRHGCHGLQYPKLYADRRTSSQNTHRSVWSLPACSSSQEICVIMTLQH